jgi:hypothetical protein
MAISNIETLLCQMKNFYVENDFSNSGLFFEPKFPSMHFTETLLFATSPMLQKFRHGVNNIPAGNYSRKSVKVV